MHNFVNKITSFFSRGITVESKKRLLLRTACVSWFGILVFITAKKFFFNQPGFQINLIVHSITAVFISSILILDIKGKSRLAHILLPIAVLSSIVVTSFFVFPAKNTELFLILVGPLAVFFARQRFIENTLFFLAFGSFIFLPKLLEIHTTVHELFHFKIFFVVIFFLVKDVDSVNRQTERILNKQKLQAEKDKSLIEMQKAELEELNDFKSKFFINVSHELRTPITIIDGFSNQIIKNKEKDPIPHVEKIIGQTKKMKDMVGQILDLSKMKLNKLILNLNEVDLTNLLSKVYFSFLPLFQEKNIAFTLDIKHNRTIDADAIYLERALNNIILNSLKYTNSGEVKLSLIPDENDELIIHITDTGIGIKEDDKDKVFQEFYQVDNEVNHAGGSGIGLSFAKNIAQLHKGNIEIESTYGQGTKVSFKLNTTGIIHEVKEEYIPQEYTPTITPKSKAYSNQRPSILVVEDHSEMMNYLDTLLCDNYMVYKAYNGVEALSIINKEKIDFVITDYMMPKMNGAEFIKELRKQGKDTPVIVLTARTDIETKLDVLRMGIDDYLHKPFNADELLIKIENRLENFTEATEEKEEESNVLQTSEFISDLSKFVDENCQDSNFKLEFICRHFGLSESSLYRKVKAETGLNPMAFIKEVRFLKARKLLETRQINSSKQLVLSVGIKNIAYFKKDYFNRFGTHINDLID